MEEADLISARVVRAEGGGHKWWVLGGCQFAIASGHLARQYSATSGARYSGNMHFSFTQAVQIALSKKLDPQTSPNQHLQARYGIQIQTPSSIPFILALVVDVTSDS